MEVFPRLYLGDRYTSENGQFLLDHGIGFILNVSNLPNVFENQGCTVRSKLFHRPPTPLNQEPLITPTELSLSLDGMPTSLNLDLDSDSDSSCESEMAVDDDIAGGIPSDPYFKHPLDEENEADFELDDIDDEQLTDLDIETDRDSPETERSKPEAEADDNAINWDSFESALLSSSSSSSSSSTDSVCDVEVAAVTPPTPVDTNYGSVTFLNPLTYLKLAIEDTIESNLIPILPEALEFIDSALKCNSEVSVLVHCAHGKSRSVSVVLAYAMEKCRMRLVDVYAKIVKLGALRGHSVALNLGFQQQLMEFEKLTFPELLHNTLDFFGGVRNERKKEGSRVRYQGLGGDDPDDSDDESFDLTKERRRVRVENRKRKANRRKQSMRKRRKLGSSGGVSARDIHLKIIRQLRELRKNKGRRQNIVTPTNSGRRRRRKKPAFGQSVIGGKQLTLFDMMKKKKKKKAIPGTQGQTSILSFFQKE